MKSLQNGWPKVIPCTINIEKKKGGNEFWYIFILPSLWELKVRVKLLYTIYTTGEMTSPTGQWLGISLISPTQPTMHCHIWYTQPSILCNNNVL